MWCESSRSARLESSDRPDVYGLRALVARLRLVLHARTLGEGPESLGVDVAVMHEQVLARLVGSHEAEALVIAEPLHRSGRHARNLPARWRASHYSVDRARRAAPGRSGST